MWYKILAKKNQYTNLLKQNETIAFSVIQIGKLENTHFYIKKQLCNKKILILQYCGKSWTDKCLRSEWSPYSSSEE